MKIAGVHVERRSTVYFVGDVVVAIVALAAALAFRTGTPIYAIDLAGFVDRSTGAASIFVLSHVLFIYISEAYAPSRDYRKPSNVMRLWTAMGAASLMQTALFYMLPYWSTSRALFLVANIAFFAGLTFWRGLMCQIRPKLSVRHRTVILGADQTGHDIASAILKDPEVRLRYDIVGFVDDPNELLDPINSPSGLSIVGGRSALRSWVAAERIGSIIVAIRSGMSPALTRQLLECKAAGILIEDMRVVYKRMTGKVPVQYVSDTSIIFGPEFAGRHGTHLFFQRLADIAVSALGLLLSAPLVALAGIAVKLETKGPVMYSQTRVGLDEKPFTIYKLRSMGINAEAKSGAVWSQGPADPRVTRVGRFLRRTRIDELPQFYNVFVGDMSMVGPRPERPHFVEQLKGQIPYYSLRFAVKPGVTGWAQVMYHYGASVDDSREKLCYDLYAIQEANPALYGLILLKTVQTVLLKPGS